MVISSPKIVTDLIHISKFEPSDPFSEIGFRVVNLSFKYKMHQIQAFLVVVGLYMYDLPFCYLLKITVYQQTVKESDLASNSLDTAYLSYCQKLYDRSSKFWCCSCCCCNVLSFTWCLIKSKKSYLTLPHVNRDLGIRRVCFV